MWIIGFAEGGFIGPFLTERIAFEYRDLYLDGRVANVLKLESPAHRKGR